MRSLDVPSDSVENHRQSLGRWGRWRTCRPAKRLPKRAREAQRRNLDAAGRQYGTTRTTELLEQNIDHLERTVDRQNLDAETKRTWNEESDPPTAPVRTHERWAL